MRAGQKTDSQRVRREQNSDIDLASADVIRDLAAASLVFVRLCVRDPDPETVYVGAFSSTLYECVSCTCVCVFPCYYRVPCNRRMCVL